MTTLEWCLLFAAVTLAPQMKAALRISEFSDEMRRKRPRPHTFG